MAVENRPASRKQRVELAELCRGATDLDDEMYSFENPSELNLQIGKNVAEFLADERKRAALPSGFLSVQSGPPIACKEG